MPLRTTAALFVTFALAACSLDPAATGSTDPNSAEAVCLRAVQAVTNNPDQTVITAEVGSAGTRVVVGVGPDRALWQCVAQADGTTTGVMSLTDEGAL